MMMSGPSTDQIAVFLSVVDQGSFSGAAKTLKRAQSAVTYAIKRLEAQVGTELFDRSEYRAVLTEAGLALLPNARRVADAVASFSARATSLANGYEAEISLVVDSMFPMQRVHDALRSFNRMFPAIPTRLYVESYVGTGKLLLDETCVIGLLTEQSCAAAGVPLTTRPVGAIELVLVAAPSHPLAATAGPIAVEDMHDHVRLVLGDRSQSIATSTAAYYGSLWFVSDIAAKRDLLLTGVGWGIIPMHMIEQDLADGRLVRIEPEKSDYSPSTRSADGRHVITMFGAHRTGRTLGPASRWLLDYFCETERTRQSLGGSGI